MLASEKPWGQQENDILSPHHYRVTAFQCGLVIKTHANAIKLIAHLPLDVVRNGGFSQRIHLQSLATTPKLCLMRTYSGGGANYICIHQKHLLVFGSN